MSAIIPFDFETNAVRVTMLDRAPWFVAADVCRALGIANPSDAISLLDDDERLMVNLNTLGTAEGIRGNPNAAAVSESGLYALIFTSRKDEARRFRKWVTAEVLPSIRQTGRYGRDSLGADREAELLDRIGQLEDRLAQMAQCLPAGSRRPGRWRDADMQDRIEQLEGQMAHLVQFLPIFGHRPVWWHDIEVRAFVTLAHRQIRLVDAERQMIARFGPERALGKSTISRYWCRLDKVLAAKPGARLA